MLNRNDFINLGWESVKNHYWTFTITLPNKTYSLFYAPGQTLVYNSYYSQASCDYGKEIKDKIFSGAIENVDDLKTLMRLLGIEREILIEKTSALYPSEMYK